MQDTYTQFKLTAWTLAIQLAYAMHASRHRCIARSRPTHRPTRLTLCRMPTLQLPLLPLGTKRCCCSCYTAQHTLLSTCIQLQLTAAQEMLLLLNTLLCCIQHEPDVAAFIAWDVPCTPQCMISCSVLPQSIRPCHTIRTITTDG